MLSEKAIKEFHLNGMTSSKTKKRIQPSVEYKLADETSEVIDSAFDILFEETFNKYGNLTTNDN